MVAYIKVIIIHNEYITKFQALSRTGGTRLEHKKSPIKCVLPSIKILFLSIRKFGVPKL